MPLFAVYVASNGINKSIGSKRVAVNRRQPLTYIDKAIIANRLFGENPPPILWLMADDELEIEDRVREQFESLAEFIGCYGKAV